MSISLSIEEMRAPNPVNKMSSVLSAMPHMSKHKGALHIILTEIYSNALEHSILNIKSDLKTDEDNFVEYYRIRDIALQKTESATIDFNFVFVVDVDDYYLDIKVTDSGSGYHKTSSVNDEYMLYGRGLGIISGLSNKASFSDDGKILNVRYKL